MTKFLGETALQELVTKTKDLINGKVSSVYKPVGSVSFENLPTLSSTVLGNVYNVTDSFTVTSDFVEYDSTPQATQNTYPEGTNVVVVNTGTSANPSYKFDVLAGFVDLGDYYTKSETNTFLAAKASSTDVTSLTNNTTKIANTNGGFAAGTSATCSSGGSVGNGASSVSGFAGGNSAAETNGGGAIGYSATTTVGGAVGSMATSTTGGAIGGGASCTTGFSGGLNAKATADGAVQLGTGTNSTANTLQFRSYTLMNSSGKVPGASVEVASSATQYNQKPISSDAVYTALQSKQNSLTFDSSPTSASTNPVTSGGVYTALSSKQDSMTEITAAEVDVLFS